MRMILVEAITLAALLVVAVLMAAIFAMLPVHPDSLLTRSGTATLVFLATLFYGVLPVTLGVAPIYAWLEESDGVSWARVCLIGVVPAAAIVWVEPGLALEFATGGVAVACLTHGTCQRLVRHTAVAQEGADH